MLYSGLVSVTFRQLSPQEIVDLVAQAGLDSIEWGGDVHVPHGDLSAARAIRKMTADAGLRVSAYGSYYRAGHPESGPFEAVLETALTLGTPTIRVWAGKQDSAQSDQAYRKQVVRDSQRIAAQAKSKGVMVAYEFHNNTLTDTTQSALELLKAVNHSHVKTFWQPPHRQPVSHALAGLEAIFPWLLNVHAFYWHVDSSTPPVVTRLPLADGTSVWHRYLNRLSRSAGNHFVSLEFVQDNSPAQFLKDAETLKNTMAIAI